MAEDASGERTEPASPRRREKAREEGQVAKSTELNGAVVLLIGMTMLLALTGHFARVLGCNSSYLFSQAHLLQADNFFGLRSLLVGNLEVMAVALGPLLVAVLVTAFGINVAQVGLQIAPAAMAPKLSKLNPITGMKKFFQKKAFFELAKNVAKIGVIGLISYLTISTMIGGLTAVPLLTLPTILAVGQASFIELMAKLLGFMFLLAIIDWIWQKRQFEDSIKMSKHEIKQENKDIEGDPQIKARIRGLQMEMARKRMLVDVPTADVVVTNPTHYAVALKYEAGAVAPKVVAKGTDNLADVIKKIARKARVPVIENRTLARALYRQVNLGDLIPDSLYKAAAEVLAYVYRLRKA